MSNAPQVAEDEAPAPATNDSEMFVQQGLQDYAVCDKKCHGFFSGNHSGTFKFIVAPKGTKLENLPSEFRSHPYRLSTLTRNGMEMSEAEVRSGVSALKRAVQAHAHGQTVNITYEGPHTVTDVRTDQNMTFHVFVIRITP